MIRSPNGSTIISYHSPGPHQTKAHALKTRMLLAGQSRYWKKIFASTIAVDPTPVLLSLLWYPIYTFDESFETLYDYICWLVRAAHHAYLPFTSWSSD
jgi:hypothetical protein